MIVKGTILDAKTEQPILQSGKVSQYYFNAEIADIRNGVFEVKINTDRKKIIMINVPGYTPAKFVINKKSDKVEQTFFLHSEKETKDSATQPQTENITDQKNTALKVAESFLLKSDALKRKQKQREKSAKEFDWLTIIIILIVIVAIWFIYKLLSAKSTDANTIEVSATSSEALPITQKVAPPSPIESQNTQNIRLI